ncbi:transposase [Ammoniphilus sp. CFH 90114]|uniref:transposase n=1 Tax=Ammoniphilus sp. CFH 90114 TaxID=2493665 RepID=UPI001F0CA8B9|nr:transposase [Ammoniphilus sp. CFH 90114]
MKKLSTKAYLLVFLHAQLQQREGLRVFRNILSWKSLEKMITQMEILIDEKVVMYVFDRGYVDYEKFDRYCDHGIFFATRLKKNAIFRVLESFKVPDNSPILISWGSWEPHEIRMDNVLRLIETTDSEGKIIRFLTNRFDLEAEELGECFGTVLGLESTASQKRRWIPMKVVAS